MEFIFHITLVALSIVVGGCMALSMSAQENSKSSGNPFDSHADQTNSPSPHDTGTFNVSIHLPTGEWRTVENVRYVEAMQCIKASQTYTTHDAVAGVVWPTSSTRSSGKTYFGTAN